MRPRPNEKLEHLRPMLEQFARRLSPVVGHNDQVARDRYAEAARFVFPDPPFGAPWSETLEVGQLAMCHSRGAWRQGIVVSMGSAHSEPGSRWIHVALVTHRDGPITKVSVRPWDVGRRPTTQELAS